MQELIVEGGRRLCGELTIQGSKNGVLPVLAATIVCAGECRIENCPRLRDVDASVAILRHLGCYTRWESGALIEKIFLVSAVGEVLLFHGIGLFAMRLALGA